MDHISPVLWQFLVKWLTHFALFPPEASKIAPEMDALYFFMALVSLVGLTLVVLLIIGFSILYNKNRHPKATASPGTGSSAADFSALERSLPAPRLRRTSRGVRSTLSPPERVSC